LYLQRVCANLTEYKKLHHNHCIINIKNLRMTLPKGGGAPVAPVPKYATVQQRSIFNCFQLSQVLSFVIKAVDGVGEKKFCQS